MQTPESVMTYAMGSTVLLDRLCQDIHFEETHNRMLVWDEYKGHLSPGTRLKAMVLNILSSHAPSTVSKTFTKQDLELLFGESAQAEDFNDDALARALDKRHAADAWKDYSTLALEALKAMRLPLRFIHGDTLTSAYRGFTNKGRPT